MERIDILQNVGLAVCDEDHVELVKRLVDESDIILFDSGVLGARVGELREGGKEGFNSGSGHLTELSRENSFPTPRTDGCG